MMALALAMPSFVHAQPGAIVQPLPSAAAVNTLNQNLARLSKNPRDVDALLGAGQAALDLGDVEAANGFYTRANIVNSNLGKAKLGLAIVELALKQPAESASNFDAADALGEHAQTYLADRGLAYDLTGQQDKAQRDYVVALQTNPSDEKARLRYAVSLGISGQIAAAEKQLEPALASGDREAWRLRAFILAMNGKQAESRKITQSVMPKGLADALDPYMLRVPLLTAGQKAAAAHYGDFPANVLRLAAPNAVPDVQLATATQRESGKKDRSSKRERDRKAAEQASAAAAAAQRAPELMPPGPPPQSVALAEPTRMPPQAASPAQPFGRPTVTTPTPPARATPAPSPTRPSSTTATVQATPPTRSISSYVARPTDPATTSIVRPDATAPVVVSPTTTAPVPAPVTERRSLADMLSTLDVPEAERSRTVAAADMSAVAKLQADRRKAEQDRIKKEVAAKAKAEADAKAKAEAERKAKLKANPARIWVQIAAGKNVDALAFDLRRLRKSYSESIGDQAGWTANWGQTNRLLVGPFKKIDTAKDVVSKVGKSGGDAFVWQSEAGEEVAKIGGK
jgi:tetratricopeptide (TPR) repeat protein